MAGPACFAACCAATIAAGRGAAWGPGHGARGASGTGQLAPIGGHAAGRSLLVRPASVVSAGAAAAQRSTLVVGTSSGCCTGAAGIATGSVG